MQDVPIDLFELEMLEQSRVDNGIKQHSKRMPGYKLSHSFLHASQMPMLRLCMHACMPKSLLYACCANGYRYLSSSLGSVWSAQLPS